MAINFHSRRVLLPGFFILMAVSVLVGCSTDIPALAKNKATPEFNLKNLQGQTIEFPKQFDNQVVIISFWADWCPSCYREMSDLENIFQQYKNQGLSILAINIEQDRKTAIAFMGNLKLSYETLFDSNGDTARNYSVSALPAAFIINKDGTLHTRVLGETPPEVFQKILGKLL
ncbi:MAG: TlpA family protein disulfide reductase [Gammaproteobacteria bacterium]|jgi:cytochrome c biogenesis protein CcmG, thiol:disulfide interchange protein DsbE|nr:TlpA family protein disulfide reductase [Gammaproteobacteria bacterium]MBT3725357.1 TlpA family protein disulfide reductase [Gammaproteobacteria bacterium]MBT4194838.1 TlpA family protein disulfide reductase [Gammaproteobacteria bacterium]MBT4450993.1 TlpA family protein disulfide reductase [Gammaproteobacteria bacterium]MBT4861740.1 TlpA family protein disulfide reductase [Gammaproteobacteria bacterium]